ncbi:MAG: TIGR03960 family B12-binding radical SAM protein [Flexistipes sinusarabici]|uniref:TIGR03960 family B12-binding radical SAM protein n=1 Tax=Flexistipes sinusarabici TaxID=2352 RepID=A0A5D0MV64_FLESI|nr:TIGR03960 family B12-binding radical SAM protein [Flexistipes sinusarabici]TYB36026.1 MAG: TIGR03960 family B12-binding radical SAM protein [Flexistipes sinusarabici]
MNFHDFLKVSKPPRYLGNEINSYRKDYSDKLRVCLSFPDNYEVGMSHLGIKILYESLNRSPLIYAERFFMPWPDAIDKMGRDIFVSLESKTPLKEFDLLGFSVQYELSYSNILSILLNAGIPAESQLRNGGPVVVAGGPCVYNPKPLEKFTDVFFIGEMDYVFTEICEEYAGKKFAGRRERLEFFDSYDFTYVPSVNPAKRVGKKVYTGFKDDISVDSPVVPLIPAVQDRVVSEISRGCSRGCRFCQAGMIYRPVRERNVDDIVDNILTQLKNTGYETASLLSLSAADYSCLEDLLVRLSDIVKNSHTSISLPSLRADKIEDYIFRELSRVRKSGFTIAPEAGSERMRKIINKNLSEDEIIAAVKAAADNGWKTAKLYFMIGLPFESEEDVLGIAALVGKIKRSVKGKGGFSLSVSVSNFVPKPFTPFQWWPQNSTEELTYKQNILKPEFRKMKIKYSFHDIHQSVMEAAISKGDESLGDILLEAVRNGVIFDGWSEYFDFNKWMNAFKHYSSAPEDYSTKILQPEDELPWDFIDIGVKKEFLISEFEKSKKEVMTKDCRSDSTSICIGCGVCDFDLLRNEFALPGKKSFSGNEFKRVSDTDQKYFSYVIDFEKKDSAVLFSAIETCRAFAHVFKMCDVDISYSRGYNPQPRISYIYPLSVGVEGYNEKLIIKAHVKDKDLLLGQLNKILPSGFRMKDIRPFENKMSDEMIAAYSLDSEAYMQLIEAFDEERAFYKKTTKRGREKIIDLKEYLVKKDDENCLVYVKINGRGSFNFLEFFRQINYIDSKVSIARKNIFFTEELQNV